MQTYQKFDIAKSQLETALTLFFDHEDMFSVLTLAGAAEEILGNLLKSIGKTPALESLVGSWAQMDKLLTGNEHKFKEYVWVLNYSRNSIKHHDVEDSLDIQVDLENEMLDMLERAVDNFYQLDIEHSALVDRYNQWLQKKRLKDS